MLKFLLPLKRLPPSKGCPHRSGKAFCCVAQSSNTVSSDMTNTIFAAVLCSGLLWPASFVQAAPAPRGIALNQESRECAGFWPGDEFVVYTLPEHWQPYFPEYDPKTGMTTLVTERGACDYKRTGDEEKCCKELGYKYVSDNIGYNKRTLLRDKEGSRKETRGRDIK